MNGLGYLVVKVDLENNCLLTTGSLYQKAGAQAIIDAMPEADRICHHVVPCEVEINDASLLDATTKILSQRVDEVRKLNERLTIERN